MKVRNILYFSLLSTTLMGCSATSNIDTITPLNKGQEVTKVHIKSGLSISLAPSKYFENLDANNNEKSFHSKIEYIVKCIIT